MISCRVDTRIVVLLGGEVGEGMLEKLVSCQVGEALTCGDNESDTFSSLCIMLKVNKN